MDAKQLMSDAKFYESYSRYLDDEGRYETWDEAVSRVMDMHKFYYKDKLTPELLELMGEAERAYKDKLFLGSQRALQFGGEQLLKNHNKLYNCFSVDTRFVTDSGVKAFSDFKDGDKCNVLTHTGKWKPAVVKSYGTQELNKVTVSKGIGNYKDILVTGNHRWLLANGDETTTLKQLDKLVSVPATLDITDWDKLSDNEKLYWCYGFVYGDGTVGTNGYSKVRLCNHKRKYEERFTELGFTSSSSTSLEGDIIISTGSYKKTLPDPDTDSVELITSFVSGYLAADGEKNGNPNSKLYNSIQATGKETNNFIRKCFPIAGVYILNETIHNKSTNFGSRNAETIRFSLFEGSRKNTKTFKVTKIKEAVVSAEVWCLEVKDDKSFVLENGLVTGNCTASYIDRVEVFGEIFHLMLSGCGVGFSVQGRHISKLPQLTVRGEETVTYTPEDSIEGWANTVDVLLSSYFVGGGKHPEFNGKQVNFDLSKIRPRGAMISGGFKAPGPEGLRIALDKIEIMLTKLVENGAINMPSIVAYDIIMFISDAVISGGVRRSASICLFSPDDDDMLNAKTGDWFIDNAQRGRN